MIKTPIPAKAGRLVKAVASIGYDPEVALCDLMDNSIDAGAKKLIVCLVEKVRDLEGEGDTVAKYVIADDGVGMGPETLVKAFTLGSDREYPHGSLGKFGIGLKSAGLSLGSRITIVSRPAGGALTCAILSVEDIEASGEYRIDLGEPPAPYAELWDKYAPEKDHGTVLIIEELTEQPAFSAFIPYFRRYCSNTYHLFLEDKENPLTIVVNEDTLLPIDPLFLSEAKANGALLNPDDWDGKTVRLLIADHELLLDNDTKCVVAATHLIHPPSFEAEGRREQMRDQYQIETDPYTFRPRHGFYVYRNKRIIVMAERFHGLISNQTQAWSFRGRLMFDESADDVLALDVKKRHMQLPKGARNNLKNLMANYQRKSVDAWKHAGQKEAERKKERKDALANESIKNSPVSKLDYAPGADLSSAQAVTDRRELQARVGVETLNSVQDTNISKAVLTQRAEARDAVVQVEGLKANAMWLPYPAVELGHSETLVNKAHTWIAESFAAAEDDPRIAIVLYQLFTILARAELEVRSTTWPDLPPGAADKLLDRFRRKASAIGEDLAESLAAELRRAAGEQPGEE